MRHTETVQGMFVDTPAGIFTASGVWFRTTEALLQDYAGPVLEKEPVPRLLRDAEVWLRSPQTLALWALPLLLLLTSPWLAATEMLALYLGWAVAGPSLVNRPAVAVLRVLDQVLLQALYFIFVLSMLGAQGQLVAVWVGLGGFILIRWGLVGRLLDPLTDRLRQGLYEQPVPDYVLRAVIMRAAHKHRLPLPELDRMEQQMMQRLTRKK